MTDSSLDLEKYLTQSGYAVLMSKSIKQQTTTLLSSWYIYNTTFILNNKKIHWGQLILDMGFKSYSYKIVYWTNSWYGIHLFLKKLWSIALAKIL